MSVNGDFIEEELKKVQAKHDEILVRCISVTDADLKESLLEEYQILAEKLQIMQIEYDEYNLDKIAKEMMDERKEFYNRQFTNPMSLLNICEEKFNLSNECKKLKYKPIINITKQRRELVMILNELDASIVITDYQGKKIYTMGKGVNKIHVNVAIFLDDYNEKNKETIINDIFTNDKFYIN